MIRLNRMTEYGLIALWHMDQKKYSDSVSITSAREVAERYGLPFEITAKTLLKLKDAGLIFSSQGANGGYFLKTELKDVTLADFLSSMEGPQSLVVCTFPQGQEHVCECEYDSKCGIKGFMNHLNKKVFNFLSQIRLNELEEYNLHKNFSVLALQKEAV